MILVHKTIGKLKNGQPKVQDEFFLSLLEKGEEYIFETLFRLYYAKLVQIAKGYLDYHQDAESIVQNVFLKLWENKGTLKEVNNINCYLFTMTKNSCLDQLKHEKVKREYFDKNYILRSEIQTFFLHDEAASLLLENELEKEIIRSIELLPDKCKSIFKKSRFEGLKRGEIAAQMGISQRTVDNHISNALKHLRLRLRKFITSF